jgi:hypothetical protein
MLSKQAIKEYQDIFKKEFGEDISYEEADLQGTRLIRLFQIFIDIDKKEHNNQKILKE